MTHSKNNMLKLFLKHVITELAISTIAEQIGVNISTHSKIIKSVYTNSNAYSVGDDYTFNRRNPSRRYCKRIHKIIQIEYEGKLAFDLYDENNSCIVTLVPHPVDIKIIYM